VIPDDYTTIQEGINNASPEDTIFVRYGIYNENILIETEGLTLIGENKYNTTISSKDSLKNTTKINALNVTIQGFSIVNATGSGALWDTSGVFVCSSNVVVKDNLIYGNRLGISALNIAYNLTICDNVFSDDGIIFGDYEHTPDNIKHVVSKKSPNFSLGDELRYFFLFTIVSISRTGASARGGC